jgi:hypothetical protein
MPSVIRRLSLAAAALAGASLADAYPIAPVTLWELTEQAELVVLARVTAVESPRREKGARSLDSDTARLQIVEVWKGSASGEVSVAFTRGMICPAPPRYVVGETVLAFLEPGTNFLASLGEDVPAEEVRKLTDRFKDRWLTVGLSYGTLYPEADDRPFLRDLVEEALVLQGEPRVSEARRRAWHVRAASRRVTRWQGLYALDREADEVHSFYDRRKSSRSAPTTDERREVMRGFIQEPSDDHTLVMALSFVGRQPEPEFDRAVLGQVERLLAEPDVPYWLGDALARLAERHGSRNGRRDLGLKKDFEEPDPAALRSAWQRTRARYGIPEVPPAPAPPQEPRGVAGLTPD